MSPPVQYGGDEVGALVLDIGIGSVRAGYAGEDCPKTVFPTSYSSVPSSEPSQPPSYIHGVSSQLYRPNGTIQSFVQDGIVTDWDAAERAIDHAFSDRMRLKSLEEYPLLVTEPSWNTNENGEKAVACSRRDLNGVGQRLWMKNTIASSFHSISRAQEWFAARLQALLCSPSCPAYTTGIVAVKKRRQVDDGVSSLILVLEFLET